MRSHVVVLVSPELNLLSGISEVGEPALVQAFVTKLTVEALDMAVLRRFARLDEVQLYAALEGPGVESLGDELRTIVDADVLRLPPHRRKQRHHRSGRACR